MFHDTIKAPSLGAPKIKGRMRLQLHDAESGELQKEIVKDNYVSQNWFDDHSALMKYDTGWLYDGSNAPTWFGANDATTKRTRNQYWIYQYGFGTQVPFGGLLLTDAADAINTADRAIKGSTVACGAIRYTSSGAAKSGTYNASESTHSRTFHRFVYDFATSQGNGIIQSIYTGEFSVDDSNPYWAPSISTIVSSGNVSNSNYKWHTIAGPGGISLSSPNRASGYANTVLYRADFEDVVGARPQDGIVLTLPWQQYSFGTDGTKVVFIKQMNSYSSTSRTLELISTTWADIIASIAADGTLSSVTWTVERTFDNTELTGTLGFVYNSSYWQYFGHGMAYQASTDTWFFTNCSTNSGTTSMVELNATTWAIENVFTGYVSDRLGELTFISGEEDYFIGDRTFGRINRSSGTVEWTLLVPNGNSNHSSYPGAISGIGSRFLLVGGSLLDGSYQTNALASSQQFFSRVRLDESVEKTSTNTMKVIYEFTLEDVDLLA